MQLLSILPSHGVPDDVIDTTLLGRGLNATGWQCHLAEQGYPWTHSLRNYITKREFWYFKLEIECLRAENPRPTALGGRSNSCKSVLMRIRGETGEREQRLREGRLFGREASLRTFEEFVKKWKTQASANTSPASLTSLNRSTNQTEVLDFPSSIREPSPVTTLNQDQVPSNSRSNGNSNPINAIELSDASAIIHEKVTAILHHENNDRNNCNGDWWSNSEVYDSAADFHSSSFDFYNTY